MDRLASRHALLTGAGGGIGLAVAAACLAEGVSCTVVDLASQASDGVADLAARYPAHVHYLRADVTDPASVQQMLAAAESRFGPVDILFNNAAVFDMAPLLASSLAMYERLFDVNVKGMFQVMQQVLQRMVDAGRSGAIINLASQAGCRDQLYPVGGAGHGAAWHPRECHRAGRHRYADVAARRCAVCALRRLAARRKKAAVGLAVPLRRMGTPADVAGAAIFLASDEAAYITAQTINVDGGSVMS